MKYLVGTTSREYAFAGIVTPKSRYAQHELNAGKKLVVAITDERFEEMCKQNRCFAQLISTGVVIAHDELPDEYQDATTKAKARLAEVEALLAAKEAEIAALRAAPPPPDVAPPKGKKSKSDAPPPVEAESVWSA